MIDTTVGPYRLLRRLGAGGMGEVYLAEDSRLRRQVALKRLTDRTLCGAEVRARILREARAAGKLQHPGIAAVFDVVEDGEAVWIVMEYVPGETLAARLKRDRLPVDAALGIGTQIAEALAHAHAHGVVHCDLKPSNVQLTPDGRVRVLDFGLAQRPERALAAEETRLRSLDVSQADSGRVTGTAGYMAPERLRGLRPDERSDVYSLGVVLFQLLTGRKPFAGTDLVAVAAAALSAPAPAASSVEPEIPGAVSLVVSRALSADPAARFASATELVMALRAATGAGASSGSAARHPLVARVAVPVALTVLILSGVGVLVLLAGWWPGSPGPAPDGPPAVVVKPFANLSGDATNDYLGVGLADNLTTRLAALPRVTVMSRATTTAYLTEHPNSSTLARDLGASYVVDGGIARSGNQLSVTITLLQPDGAVAWGREFDGTVAGLFVLQRELAQGVADGLNLVLSEDDRLTLAVQPTDNVEAFADYSQGRTFLDRRDVDGNLDRAITLFDQAIAKDPEFALAHAGVSAAYWQKYVNTNDAAWTTRAIDAGLEALRLDPRQADVHVALATAYHGLGRTPAAIDALDQALALQPNNDDAHRLLGDIHAAAGRTDEAVAAYERAIAIRPNYWQNHNRLAVALLRAGRYKDATASCVRVTELQPDSAIGFNNLGVVGMMEGDLALAERSLTRATEISPRASNLSNLGTIHYWNGRFADARRAYEQAIALRPDSMDIRRNLGDALSRLGESAAAEAEYRIALEGAANALKVNPRDGRSLGLLGLLEAKLGRPAEARARVTEALAAAPNDGDIHYRSAVVAALAGDREMALAALTRALALGYSPALARRDPDLLSLGEAPGFAALLDSRTPRDRH
jgi:tetratricopeptide (TPR) repeat protein/tRNA A-37 threonylcarbamoyl transferase component Bud32